MADDPYAGLIPLNDAQPAPQGRLVIRRAPTPHKELRGNQIVDLDSGSSITVPGLPTDDKPKDHFRLLNEGDPGYRSDRPGQINETTGQISYGPQNAAQQAQPFKVGDADEIAHGFQMLDNVAAARQLAQLPNAAGTWATTVSNIPVVGGAMGQNRANLMTKLGAVSGDLRNLGIVKLYQMTGQKGVGTLARSNAEQQALQNSMAALGYDATTLKPTGAQPDASTLGEGLTQAQSLYERHLARLFNMDPDNPTSLHIIQAAEANPQNRQALVQSFKDNGGSVGQLRFVTKADGHDIPPILVPKDATDEQIRAAVTAAGYNVNPASRILTGPFTGGPNPETGGAVAPSGGAPKGPPPQGAFKTFDNDMSNALTFGLGPSIEAAAASLVNGHSFDENLAAIHARDKSNDTAHPVAGWAGTLSALPAFVGSAPEAGLSAIARGGPSLVKQALKSNLVTVPVGATEGAAEAGSGNRVKGAVKGGAIAGAVGTAATPAIALGGRLIGWLGSKILPEIGAWNAFTHVAPEADPEAMANQAADLRSVGVEPAALDTLNDSSLDHVRTAIGSREGSKAATILNEEAASRSAKAPTDLTAHARAVVGKPPVTPPHGVAADPEGLRTTLSAKRDQQFADTVAPVRGVPLKLPGEVTDMLEDADMASIIKGALGFTNDPVERDQIAHFAAAMKKNPSGHGDMLPSISLGAADALRQSLAKAEGANTPAITATRQALTGFLEHVPQYRDAMKAYRIQSRIASPDYQRRGRPEAIDLGSQVLSGDPGKMRQVAAKMPPLDTPVVFGTGPDAITITPRQAAGEGVVRAIQEASNTSGGVKSMGRGMVLENGDQQARNGILFTPDQSLDLENRISAGSHRIEAANRAAPASAPGPEDEHTAISAAAATLYHSPALKGGKFAQLLSRAKISSDQANRIARGLVSKTETDAIIQKIQRAGYTQQRARQLYGMLALQLSAKSARGSTRNGAQ
jgi:hypothetical protein